MTATWTPAILSPDLPPGTVVASACGPVEVAIWRGHGGRVAAWADRCPHRGMRLSHGFVRGDWLSCIYHGWRYDEAGRCRKIPAHPGLDPPEAIRVRALACVEAGGVVWIAEAAPSDPPLAPPPDLGAVRPLRSLTVDADVPALVEAAGAPDEAGTIRLDVGGALVLLLQPMGARTAVHAMMAPAPVATLIAASRALERLRRRAEAGVAA